MKISLCIILAMLCQYVPAALAADHDPMSIEIVRLDRRARPPINGADGLLVLRFISNLNRPATIYFAGLSASPDGGDCAVLRYKWTGQKGVDAGMHTYDVSGEPLHLTKFGNAPWIVPVWLPRSSGEYVLHLEFDNKRLKQTFDTNSDVEDPKESVFFTCTTTKLLNLP